MGLFYHPCKQKRSTKPFWKLFRYTSYHIVNKNLQRFVELHKPEPILKKFLGSGFLLIYAFYSVLQPSWSDLSKRSILHQHQGRLSFACQRIIGWKCRFYRCMRRRNDNWCLYNVVWCFHMNNITKKRCHCHIPMTKVYILRADWNTCLLLL